MRSAVAHILLAAALIIPLAAAGHGTLGGTYTNESGHDFSHNDLTGANLTGANLTGANLTGANLTGANLTGANLTGATLTGATLTGATLTGATLTGATLTGATVCEGGLEGIPGTPDLTGVVYLQCGSDAVNPDARGISPVPVAAIFDGVWGFALSEASDVAVAEISGRTYAVVTSFDDDGVQRIGLYGSHAPPPPPPVTQMTNTEALMLTLSNTHDIMNALGLNVPNVDPGSNTGTMQQILFNTYYIMNALGLNVPNVDPGSNTARMQQALSNTYDIMNALGLNVPNVDPGSNTDRIRQTLSNTHGILSHLSTSITHPPPPPDPPVSEEDESSAEPEDGETQLDDMPDSAGAESSVELEDGETLTGSVALGDLDRGVPASILLIDPDGDPVSSGIMSITLTPDIFVPDATLGLEISPGPIGDVPDLPSAPYLFFDVNLPDADFSDPASFSESGLPRIKFTVPTTTDIPETLADGCPASSVFLFDGGDWAQLGHPLIGGNQIYVTNTLNNSVSIVDIASNEVVKRVKVGTDPGGAAFNAQTGLLYVSNTGSDSVTVVDVARHVTTAIEVGALPSGVAVDETNNVVYVVQAGGGITVINGSSNEVAGSIGVPGASPDGIAFDFAGMRGYVGDLNGTISVIDLTTNTVTGEIYVGGGPAAIAVDPDAGVVYSSVPSLGAVVAINATTNTVMHTIPVGGSPSGLVFNPNGDRVYVGDTLSNAVLVIDARTHSVSGEIPIGQAPHGMGIIQSTNTLYVTGHGGGDIVAIDADTGTVLGSIKADAGSRAIAVNPSVSNPVRVPFADTTRDDGVVECSYAAGLPHLSKFAIGGIKPKSAPVGGGATDTAPPAFDHTGSGHVSINGDAFHIEHFEARTGTQTFGVGDSITMAFAVLEQGGADDLARFEFLANLTGQARDHSFSDTSLQYDTSGVRVVDPHGYFSSSFVGVSDDGADLVHITVELTFARPMASSDVILRMWDEQGHSLAATIPDMIEIAE